jgi:hemin uptake protein HemP
MWLYKALDQSGEAGGWSKEKAGRSVRPLCSATLLGGDVEVALLRNGAGFLESRERIAH